MNNKSGKKSCILLTHCHLVMTYIFNHRWSFSSKGKNVTLIRCCMPGLIIVWRFALRESFGRDSAVAARHDGPPKDPTGRRMERKKQEERTG